MLACVHIRGCLAAIAHGRLWHISELPEGSEEVCSWGVNRAECAHCEPFSF
jgi:hypothetical protein